MINESGAPCVVKYSMKNTSARRGLLKKEVVFNLLGCRSNRDLGKKVAFATNVNIQPRHAQEFCDNYSKRWGIETSYRVKGDFRVRTTSKDFRVRLFFFLYSVCLYNLWVIINLLFGLLAKIKVDKPVITAKMFGTMFYSFKIDLWVINVDSLFSSISHLRNISV